MCFCNRYVTSQVEILGVCESNVYGHVYLQECISIKTNEKVTSNDTMSRMLDNQVQIHSKLCRQVKHLNIM